MSYGYSSRLIALNKRADKSKLGVALGRKCIALDIPVTEVATRLSVSRMTVYNWFAGTHEPQRLYASAINTLLKTLK